MASSNKPEDKAELVMLVMNALMNDLPLREWRKMPREERRIHISRVLEEVAGFSPPVDDNQADELEEFKEEIINEVFNLSSV